MVDPAATDMDLDDVPPPETVMTDSPVVACDGGEGALGHPRVYLNMGSAGVVDCGYCDRRFILRGGPADKKTDKADEPLPAAEDKGPVYPQGEAGK